MTLRRSLVSGWLVVALATTLASVAAAAPIDVTIYAPNAWIPLTGPNYVNGTLRVEATVTGDFEIVRVTARIGAAEFDLSYSTCAILYRTSCGNGWFVAVPIEDFQLVIGANLLEVEAEDAFGTLGSTSVTLDYVPPPVLGVVEPLEDAVATPLISVRADCQDLVPQPCGSVSVRVSGGATLLDVAGGVDHEVDLSAYDGLKVALEIVGVGASGTPGVVTRNVYVEAEPRLEEVERVGGVIRAANAEQVIFLGPGGVVWRRDRASGLDTQIYVLTAVVNPFFDFPNELNDVVVAGGTALFSVYSGTGASNCGGPNTCLFEYVDGVLTNRGPGEYFQMLAAAEPWAIWRVGSVVRRLDASTGDEILVSDVAGSRGSVAGNGDVVFQKSGTWELDRFRGGVVAPLFTLSGVESPITDGINVVYEKYTTFPNRELWIYTAAGSHELLAPADIFASNTQAVNGGWAAFTRKANDGTRQVWRRGLDGSLTKLTFFGSDTQVASVGPDGEIAFTNAGRRCSIPAGAGPVQSCDDIGSSRGTSFYLGDELYMRLGGSLFRVNVPEPGAWALQIAMFGVLAVLARRRRASIG